MNKPASRGTTFRRLQAAWLSEGLRLRSEGVEEPLWISRMTDMVKQSCTGEESIRKSMGYLRRIWLESDINHDLRSRAIQLYQHCPEAPTATILSWGMTIASYPFLNEVAAIAGRILRIQSEMKSEQFLRKLIESYGERASIVRSGKYALTFMEDMGLVQRSRIGYYVQGNTITTENQKLSPWLLKAWSLASGSSALIDRTTLTGTPSLLYFDTYRLISDALAVKVLSTERLSHSQEMLRFHDFPAEPSSRAFL